VLVIPEIAQLEPDERARAMADYQFGQDEVDWDQPQRMVSAQAGQAGLPVLDLLPAFRELSQRDALYLTSDQHFTALGHRTTAQLLANAIIAREWLR
jgi:hypothetical protein